MKYLLIFKNASDGREKSIEMEEVQAKSLAKKLNQENALFFFEVNSELIQKGQIVGFSKKEEPKIFIQENRPVENENSLSKKARAYSKKMGITYRQALEKTMNIYKGCADR